MGPNPVAVAVATCAEWLTAAAASAALTGLLFGDPRRSIKFDGKIHAPDKHPEPLPSLSLWAQPLLSNAFRLIVQFWTNRIC
jgi:hypothetical protein